MMMLTRQQARPEVPNIDNLPGSAWSAVGGFIDLMQVTISPVTPQKRKSGTGETLELICVVVCSCTLWAMPDLLM